MSVATQFAPTVPVPVRARSARERLAEPFEGGPSVVAPSVPAPRPAGVSALRPPRGAEVVAPVRLTRRGVVVLFLAVAVLGGVLVWLAALSAGGHASAPPADAVPAGVTVVTVQSGDTLWSIAGRVAPDRDPRAEVADLQRLNHLGGADLAPGQQLRVR